MGWASSDGRLVRPSDKPAIGMAQFDFDESINEMLSRSVDLRRQRWIIKQRELELLSAKNQMLANVDLSFIYRYVGVGTSLLDKGGNSQAQVLVLRRRCVPTCECTSMTFLPAAYGLPRWVTSTSGNLTRSNWRMFLKKSGSLTSVGCHSIKAEFPMSRKLSVQTIASSKDANKVVFSPASIVLPH